VDLLGYFYRMRPVHHDHVERASGMSNEPGKWAGGRLAWCNKQAPATQPATTNIVHGPTRSRLGD
jgi:hypothetical protein